MERMESMLYEAALEGNVTTLSELLQQDRLILDKVAMNSFSESPLHAAALLGHVDFVMEILLRKPELAGELDSRRCSALHKASLKGYVAIAKALLQVNPDMCFACDVDGRNPLHLAAMKGRIDVLGVLVRTRPLAASATTIWGETILHLCVKYNQLEALKFLLENMDNSETLNAKDNYGMTILHLAVADKQIQVINFLTTRTTINVNAVNANGFTALDILAQSKRDVKDWEIGESLRRAGAIGAKDNIHLSIHELGTIQTNSLTFHENNDQKQQGKDSENVHKKEDDWLEKMRNSLMVVASLIATMAFQAGVDPPSTKSTQQDTSSPENSRLVPAEPPKAMMPTVGFMFASGGFHFFNTIGFVASLSIILLLISGLPLRRRVFVWILTVVMWVAITAMAFTYMAATQITTEPENLFSNSASAVVVVWMFIEGIVYVGHITRLLFRMTKYFRNSVSRSKHIQIQAQNSHEPPIASIV